MKFVKYVTLASLAMLAACNNEEQVNVPTPQTQDVAVRLTIGAKTRAAMGEFQDKVEDNASATIENIHVYLTDASGNITVSKAFAKTDADFAKLMSAETLEANGGYKFLNVSSATTKAVVVVNPQNSIGTQSTNISALTDYTLKSQVGQVVYAGSQILKTVNTEPWGVDPQGDKHVVKAAEFDLTANMNRFQVLGTKFYKIAWKNGQKAAAEAWMATWKAQDGNQGKSDAEAWTAFKGDAAGLNNGTYNSNTGQSTGNWDTFFETVDITDQTQAVIMNRFYNNFKLSDLASSGELMFAKTFAGGVFNFENGEFRPDGVTELSEAATYFKKEGGLTIASGKAAAFNFFCDKITNYGKDGDAPTLHFIFKEGSVPEVYRFLNISGYATAEGGSDGLNADDLKGGKLINMDLSKLNNNTGIHVGNEPDVPTDVVPKPDGKPDLTSEDANVIVKVQVKNWNTVNAYPIM